MKKQANNRRSALLTSVMALVLFTVLLALGAGAADDYDSTPTHFTFVVSENSTGEDLTDDYLLVTGYKGSSSAIQIPETVSVDDLGWSETMVSKYKTAGMSTLTVKIVQSRFNYPAAYKLTHVRLGVNIEAVNAYAFTNFWETLTDVDIPEGSKLKTIGTQAFAGDFYGGSALTRIGMTTSDGTKTDKLPASVDFIYEYAFYKTGSLQSIDLSLTQVDDLRDCTFTDCGMSSIVLPDGLKYMGWSVFSGCKNLTSLTFPKDMEYIGPYAFEDCTSLTKLVLKCGVSGIGENSGGAFCSLRGINPDCTVYVPRPANQTDYDKVIDLLYRHMGASASVKLRWLNPSTYSELSITPKTAPTAKSNSVVTLSGTYNGVAYPGFSYDYQDKDKDGLGAVIVLNGKLTNDLTLTLNGTSAYAGNTNQVVWHVVSAYSARRGTDDIGYDVLRGKALTEAMVRTQSLGNETTVSTTAAQSLRLNNNAAPGIYYYIPTLINRNSSYGTSSTYAKAQSAVFLPPVMVVYRPETGDLVNTTISGSTGANLNLDDSTTTCSLCNGMRVQVPGFDAWLYDAGDFVSGVTKAKSADGTASITYQWYEVDSKTNTGGTAIAEEYGCGGTAVYDGFDRPGGSGIYWRCGGLTESYIQHLRETKGVSTNYFYLEVTITANGNSTTITSAPCVLNLYKKLSITGFGVDQSEAPAGNITGADDDYISPGNTITVKSGASNVVITRMINGLWANDGDFDGSIVTKWTCNGTTYTSSYFLSDWLPTTAGTYRVACWAALQTADGTVLSTSETKNFTAEVSNEAAGTFTDQPVFDTAMQSRTQYLQTNADGETMLTVYLDNKYGAEQSDGSIAYGTTFEVYLATSPTNNRDGNRITRTHTVTGTYTDVGDAGIFDVYKGAFQINLTDALAQYLSLNGVDAFAGHGVTYCYVKAYNKSGSNYTGVAYSPVFAVIPTADCVGDDTALSPRNVTVTEQPFDTVWVQSGNTADISVGLKTENVPLTDLVYNSGRYVPVIRWEYQKSDGTWDTLDVSGSTGVTCAYEDACTSNGGDYTLDGSVTLSITGTADFFSAGRTQEDGSVKLRLRADTEAFYGNIANPKTLVELTVVPVEDSLPFVYSFRDSGGREYLKWNSSAGVYELVEAAYGDYSVIPENECWLYSDRYDNRTDGNFGNKPGSAAGVKLWATAYYSPDVTVWQVELPDGTKQILDANDASEYPADLTYDSGDASADGTWPAYENKITIQSTSSVCNTYLVIDPPTGDSAFVMKVTPIAVTYADDGVTWKAAQAYQTYTIRVNPVVSATAASVYGSGSYYFNLEKSELPYVITATVSSPDDSVVTCQWYRRSNSDRMEPETDTPVGPTVTVTGYEQVSLELTKEVLQAFASGDGTGTAYFYLCADSYNANAVYNKTARSTGDFYQVSVNNNYKVAEKPVITADYGDTTPVHVLYGNHEPEEMRTVIVKQATSACSQSIYLYYLVRDPETAEVISKSSLIVANIVTDDSGNVTDYGTNSASDTLTFNADGTITCSISQLSYIGNSVYQGGKNYYDYDLEFYWEVVNHLSGDIGQYATGGNVTSTRSATYTVEQRRAETPTIKDATMTVDNTVTLDPYAKTDDIPLANVPAGVGAAADVPAFRQYPDYDTMRIFSYVPSFSEGAGKSGDTLGAWLEYYDTAKDGEGNDLGWTRVANSFAKLCDSSGNVTYYGSYDMPQTAGAVNYAAFYDVWRGEEDGCYYCPKDTRIFLRVAVAAQNGEYTYSASDPAYSQPFALERVSGEPVDADKPVYKGSSESFYSFTWNQDDSTVTGHSFGEDSWVIGETGTGEGALSYQWQRYSKDAGSYVNITGNATATTPVLTAGKAEMAAWAADSDLASNGRYGVSLNLVVTNTNNDPSITGSRTATNSRSTTCSFGAAPATPAATATVDKAAATAGDADLTAAVTVTGQGGDALGDLSYQWEYRVVSATPLGGTAFAAPDADWRDADGSAASSTYSIPTSNSTIYLLVPYDDEGTPGTRWYQVRGDSLWKDYESVKVEYRCKVINTEGTESVTGYSNTLTVTLNAPSFALTVSGKDSDDNTTPPLRVTEERTVTLSVTEQTGYTYQWVRYASMESAYYNSLPGSVTANETSLTITASDYSTSYPYYVCRITHTASGITQETARFYVGRENADGSAMAPVVTNGSYSLLCDVGGATTESFSVTATAPDGGALSYRWQERKDGEFTDIPGATAASLELAGYDSAPCERIFRCVVTNTKGGSTAVTQSAWFYLTVRGVVLEDVTATPVAGQAFTTTLTGTVYGLPGESITWSITGSDFGYTLTAVETTVPNQSVATVTATLHSDDPQTAPLSVTATVGGTYEDTCFVTLNVVDFTIDTDKVTCKMGEEMTPFTIETTGARPTGGWTMTGDVPAGLSINASTGVISGTPTIPGAYQVTLKAGTAEKDCTIIVRSPAADNVADDSGNLTIGGKSAGLRSDHSGTGWSWSGEAGVLTLDSSYPAGEIDFYSTNGTPLCIRMKGNVTVESWIYCGNSSAGLYLYGSGDLTVTSPAEKYNAIYLGSGGTLYDKRTAGDLTVTNNYTGSSNSYAVSGNIDGAGSAGTVTIQNTAYGSAERSYGVYGNVTCAGSGAVSITATIAASGTAACGVQGNLTQNGSGAVTVTVSSTANSAGAASTYSYGVSGTLTQNGSGAVTVTVNQNAGQAGGVYGAEYVVLNSAGPVTITADGNGYADYVNGTRDLTTNGSVNAEITGQNGTGITVGANSIALDHTGGSVTLNAAGSAPIVRAVYDPPTDATAYIVSGAPLSGAVTYTAADNDRPIFTVGGVPLTPDAAGNASYLLPLQQGEPIETLAVTAYCAGGCTLEYDSNYPNGLTAKKANNTITYSGAPGSNDETGSFQITATGTDGVETATLTVNWTMSDLKLLSGPYLYRFDTTGKCQVRAGETDQGIYFYAVGEKPYALQVFDGETKLYEWTDAYRASIYSVDNGATQYPSSNVYCYNYPTFDAGGMAVGNTKTLTVKALDNSDHVLQSLTVTVTAVDPACPDYVIIGSGYGYYNLGLYDYSGTGWTWQKSTSRLLLNGYNGSEYSYIGSDGAPLKLFVQQSSSVSAIRAYAGLSITGNSGYKLTVNNAETSRAALTLNGNALTVDTYGSVSITGAGKVLDGESSVTLGKDVQVLRMEGTFAKELSPTIESTDYYLYNGTTGATEESPVNGVFLYGTGTNVPDFTVTVIGDETATVGGSVTLTADLPAELLNATKNGTAEKAFTVTYKWESSPDGAAWTVLTGETGSTLNPSTAAVGTTRYRCTVWVNGTKSQTGDPVTLTVNPAGFTVSGTAISWNNTDNAVYLLYADTVSDADIQADMKLASPEKALAYTAVKGGIAANADGKRYDQTFSFSTVAAGTYKLAIFKPGKYVPKIVTVTVTGSDVALGEVKLWLYGDVTYDGIVKANDATQITRKANGLGSVFDTGDEQTKADRLLAADVTRDGQIKANDATQIMRYINGLGSVFNTLD